MSPCPVRVEEISPVPEDGWDDVEMSSKMEQSLCMGHSKSNQIITALTTDEQCGAVYIQTSCSTQDTSVSNDSESLKLIIGEEQDEGYPTSFPSSAPALCPGPVTTCGVPSSLMIPPGLPCNAVARSFASNVAVVQQRDAPVSVTRGSGLIPRIQSDVPTTRTPLRAAAAPFQPLNCEQKEDIRSEGETMTTVMLRNISTDTTRSMLMDVLRSSGVGDHVAFIYLPMNLRKSGNFGYAFVDFDSPEVAKQCKENLCDLIGWSVRSENMLEVVWSEAQGMEAHIERYRDSPIMHPSVADEYKPAMFKNGVRVAFPAPTKSIRAPRLRRSN